jgi:hypothetical protein
MKNINRILTISVGIFVLLLTACMEEDIPKREPSPEVSSDNAKVYFPNSNASSYELDEDDTSISLTIKRANTSGAVTVPITVLRNDSNIFVIPESVGFEDSEDEVNFNVTFSGAIPATEYKFEIIVEGDDLVDPYTIIQGAPSIEVSIALIKWEKFATGEYGITLLDITKTMDLYKAEGSNKYRFYDVWIDGVNWDFEWDGGKQVIPSGEAIDAGGAYPFYFFDPGWELEGFGSLTFYTDGSPDYTYYDEAGDFFYFDRLWYSSEQGELDWYGDYFAISERY